MTLTGPSSLNQGEEAEYWVQIVNSGPDRATGVLVTDEVPAGFWLDSARSWSTCVQSGTTVTCPWQEIASGYPAFGPNLTFTTSTIGTFTNTVSVTEDESDPTPADNTASVQTTVNPPVSADLSVSTNGRQSLYDGQRFSEGILVRNDGPDTSTGATLTVTFPSQLSTDYKFDGCAPTTAGQTCSIGVGALQPGFGLGYGILFSPAAPGEYTVTVTVTGDLEDPDLSNNNASTTVTVLPSADLAVALGWNGQAQQPYAGQPFSLDASVYNAGPDPSTGEVVTLAVPAGITPEFSGCTTSTTGMTCSVTFPDQPAGTTAVAPLQFTGTAAGQYTISATVAANEHDPNTANNSASLPVTIQPAADLALSASATPNPVTAGHKVTETIVLTNNGPSTAPSPTWTASWSSDAKGGVALVSYGISGGSCSVSGATLSCQPGDLASGGQVVLTIVLQPRSKGTLVIDSSAASSLYDATPEDNSTENSVTIS